MKYFLFKLCTGYLFVLLFCALELIPWTILLNLFVKPYEQKKVYFHFAMARKGALKRM